MNTKGTMDDVDEELKHLLAYFDNQVPEDDFTRELEDAVGAAKEHKMWRKEYMKMTLWQQDIRDEGREEGLAEGRLEERAISQKNLIRQVCRKISKGKTKEQAAEELELEVEEIEDIYDLALECAPDYDVEKVYEKYKERQTV